MLTDQVSAAGFAAATAAGTLIAHGAAAMVADLGMQTGVGHLAAQAFNMAADVTQGIPVVGMVMGVSL